MPSNDPLPPLTPQEEAEMQKELEIAIEPFLAITPPHMLGAMRETVEETLRTNPEARRLLASFVPRQKVDTSGTQAKEGAHEDDEAGGKQGV